MPSELSLRSSAYFFGQAVVIAIDEASHVAPVRHARPSHRVAVVHVGGAVPVTVLQRRFLICGQFFCELGAAHLLAGQDPARGRKLRVQRSFVFQHVVLAPDRLVSRAAVAGAACGRGGAARRHRAHRAAHITAHGRTATAPPGASKSPPAVGASTAPRLKLPKISVPELTVPASPPP